ncbi:SARP family transcriptional regulator [Longispora fulva]|uniref:DNA-binding SARP family transcriptional activator n=1 Tax=Longispora fulva TaxID=619741 RepID=A0A8J7GPH8_9ACTN|nr:BTAD domain-containing putative transcriptional regulator [Longispora fulva]MBG6135538.1 DNA-binding SARP family transcriptional activator [Longispora fulva]GIG56222.1 SARP family transcriptional regulator [Longispora fulva]
MPILLLGDVAVETGGRHLTPAARATRAMLAALALTSGRPVSADRLYGLVWDSRPSDAPRGAVQVTVHRLRRWLAAHGQGVARVVTGPGGYTLVADGPTDLDRFRELRDRAAAEPGQRRVLLEAALELWRGPALADTGLTADATALDAERTATTVACADAALTDGDPGRALTLAVPVAEADPLAEEAHAVVVAALAATGQQGAALRAFERVRRSLAQELGADPGQKLRAAHARALRPDPATTDGQAQPGGDPAAPGARPVVQLPADPADFTGRSRELLALRRVLTGTGTALPVAVLVGHAGVGKSALAVRAAHGLGGRYPDGRLFLSVRGLGAAEALARLLRALGVHGSALPAEVTERAAVFRERTSGRRLLVVLDDADSAAQVTPMLPGSATCGVLVTSRQRLTGLPGATVTTLDVLRPAESVRLLSRIIGHPVDDDTDARRVADLCGHLPLALRVAGAKLAGRPGRTLAWLADRLADERRRLDELAHDDLEVRASLALSYRSLGPGPRRLLRLLGLLQAPTFAGWVAGAVLGARAREAEDLLDALTAWHLVEPAGPDRYRLHDLIRLYAAERAADEDSPADRTGAVTRACTGWLALARAAESRLQAGPWLVPTDHPAEAPAVADRDPLDWFEGELDGLSAAVRQAADLGEAGLAWSLASAVQGFCDQRGHLDAWHDTHSVALAAATAASDTRGVAVTAVGLSRLAVRRDDYPLAERHHWQARKAFEALGDRRGVALADRGAAEFLRWSDEPAAAVELIEDTIGYLRAGDDHLALLHALLIRGMLHADAREHGPAEDLFTEGLALATAHGCIRFTAQHGHWLGRVCEATGRPELAAAHHERAEAGYRAGGDELRATYVRLTSAGAALRRAEYGSALALLTGCVDTFGRLGETLGLAQALTALGAVHLGAGRPDAAVAALTDAGARWLTLAPVHADEAQACADLLRSVPGQAAHT